MGEKKKNVNTQLRLVGINGAGLSPKFDSFDKMLSDLSPSVFFIEETKLKRPGGFKQTILKNILFLSSSGRKKGEGVKQLE